MRLASVFVLGAVIPLGCSGGDGSRNSAGDGGGTDSITTTTAGSDSQGSDSDTQGSDSDSQGSDSDSNGTSSGSATDSGGSASDSDTTDSDSTGNSTGAPKFDVGTNIDVGGQGCDGPGMGGNLDPEFSYIWISNSPQGTVSKIDTMSGIEVGRFSAGPTNPDPSRTSVNLLGDAVAVDRNGGIVKIAAREDDCVDANNNGMIDTSTNATALPWGSDECVLWHLPLPSSSNRGPRPVAWESGLDANGCITQTPRVWVGHYHQSINKGMFYRLNGDTGAILDTIEVDPWSGQSYGPYGGAVNAAGDFFVMGWNSGPLIRIDAVTLQVDQWPTPPGEFMYGMALDKDGNPWAAGSSKYHRFDVGTETWSSGTSYSGMRGLQVSKEGYVWIARPGGVNKIDVMTQQVAAEIAVAGASSPVGVSIDVEGFVWLVDQSASKAFKVDPDTHLVALEVAGLVSPYTYSDMTGAGLSLVSGPPG